MCVSKHLLACRCVRFKRDDLLDVLSVLLTCTDHDFGNLESMSRQWPGRMATLAT